MKMFSNLLAIIFIIVVAILIGAYNHVEQNELKCIQHGSDIGSKTFFDKNKQKCYYFDGRETEYPEQVRMRLKNETKRNEETP